MVRGMARRMHRLVTKSSCLELVTIVQEPVRLERVVLVGALGRRPANQLGTRDLRQHWRPGNDPGVYASPVSSVSGHRRLHESPPGGS